jgi:hypothetical protein
VGEPARRDIRAFEDGAGSGLGHAGPCFSGERGHGVVTHPRTRPQPLHLLAGLHQPKAGVLLVEKLDPVGSSHEPLVRPRRYGADDPGPAVRPGAALRPGPAGQQVQCRGQGRPAARTDIRLGCEQAGVRDVVVVGDEEHIALLGREDYRGLPGHRPARQPLDGRSGTVGAVDQGVIDPAPLEHAGQRETSALHLDRGEGRVTGRGLPGPEMP